MRPSGFTASWKESNSRTGPPALSGPPENVLALVHTVREFGCLPLDPERFG